MKTNLPNMVRCYQCIEEHVPHLYLIEKCHPIVLHSNLIGGGALNPRIRRAHETVYLCERHWQSLVIGQMFSKARVVQIESQNSKQNV